MKRMAIAVLVLGIAGAGFGALLARGVLGTRQDGGEVVQVARSRSAIAARAERQRSGREATAPPRDALLPVASQAAASDAKQILFGDLHAHTTFSFDAFSISLPMYQGEGAHPPADACDFARFCADLDFWSINDHAEGLTPQQWSEIKRTVRTCNEVAGSGDTPDLVSFLGWEWTQIGTTPENHYGHKNVILLDTAEDAVPLRPISSRQQLFPGGGNPYGVAMRLGLIAAAPGGRGRQPYHDFARFLQDREDNPPCGEGDVRALPADCQESAATPALLFERLEAWGFPYLVVPHGNTWGFYTPPTTSWDKQLRDHRDPGREFLFEVFSGHGNTEEYRPWRAFEVGEDGNAACPAPSAGYTPECWRAGEIIRGRCAAAGESAAECQDRAVEARALHVAAGAAGHLTVPGSTVEDWLDAGQCSDCYMPAYNYRPGGSLQYALALSDLSVAPRKRFRFGLIGSSDVHTARPGTGYKELQRRRMTDAGLGLLGPPPMLRDTEPAPRGVPVREGGLAGPYFERFASFFGTGGLVAVHSAGRGRHEIWDGLHRKEVYGTSGERILLWFDLVDGDESHPMGSETVRRREPAFEVRAVGAFEQKPGCPADVSRALSPARLERLCGGECYHPADRRKRIDRIEVVRIRPRIRAGEDIAELVEDPWRVLPCPDAGDGCRVRFSDADFEAGRRDSVYYVRAIQEASATVNGDQLRCTRDEAGRCTRVTPCRAAQPTAYDDDCKAALEERAWSSPIFVDHADSAGS